MLEDRWGFEEMREGRKVKSIGIAYTAWRFDWDYGVEGRGIKRAVYGLKVTMRRWPQDPNKKGTHFTMTRSKLERED